MLEILLSTKVAQCAINLTIALNSGKLDLPSALKALLGDISFLQCLVDFRYLLYYTSHRGCLVNCGGLPPISHE